MRMTMMQLWLCMHGDTIDYVGLDLKQWRCKRTGNLLMSLSQKNYVAKMKGIDIGKDDKVVGLVRCDTAADLLTVTQNGYGKRTPLEDYLVRAEDGSTRPQGRGGKGRIDIKTNERNGPVVTIRPVADGEGVVFVTLNGQLIRTDVDQISRMGRNTQGVRVVRLRDNDSLISMARVPTDD